MDTADTVLVPVPSVIYSAISAVECVVNVSVNNSE